MTPPRKRSALDTSISPPPLRRKLLQQQGALELQQNELSTTNPSQQEHRSPIPFLEGHLKILSWNINGTTHLLPPKQKSIKSFFSPSTPSRSPSPSPDDSSSGRQEPPLRRLLRRHRWPGILCLQEIKLNARDAATQLALERAANATPMKEGVVDDDGYSYKAIFCLPRDRFNGRGFGGKNWGVATFVRQDLLRSGGVGETREVTWDVEGRVLLTYLPQHKLVVLNGYWPNGTTAPYKSPQTGAITGTRHDRKREFHRLMLDEVLNLQAEGWGVAMIGDMNIAPAPIDGFPGIRLGEQHVLNRKDFNWRFLDQRNPEGLRGYDAWRCLRGEERRFTYHGERESEWGSSCDRVDLAVVSSDVVRREALVNMEIWESVLERGGSDHCPIEVVVDLGKLGSEMGDGLVSKISSIE